jgi:prepilin-type N-terminal cleavage/methylation domain-containing protein
VSVKSSSPAGRRGVTLIEMLIVVALVGLLASLTYPSVASGIDSLRLNSAAESIASFLNAGLNHAERRRVPVMVEVSKDDNALRLSSTEPGWVRKLELTEGVSVEGVEPAPPAPPEFENRLFRFLLYPGGSPPRIAVTIVNRRGSRRIVRVDPVTGVPEIERTVGP